MAAMPARPTLITRLPDHLSPQTLTNALLLVDKPRDWSTDEVARCVIQGTGVGGSERFRCFWIHTQDTVVTALGIVPAVVP